MGVGLGGPDVGGAAGAWWWWGPRTPPGGGGGRAGVAGVPPIPAPGWGGEGVMEAPCPPCAHGLPPVLHTHTLTQSLQNKGDAGGAQWLLCCRRGAVGTVPYWRHGDTMAAPQRGSGTGSAGTPQPERASIIEAVPGPPGWCPLSRLGTGLGGTVPITMGTVGLALAVGTGTARSNWMVVGTGMLLSTGMSGYQGDGGCQENGEYGGNSEYQDNGGYSGDGGHQGDVGHPSRQLPGLTLALGPVATRTGGHCRRRQQALGRRCKGSRRKGEALGHPSLPSPALL